MAGHRGATLWQLLGLAARSSVLPGAATRSGPLRSAVASVRWFSAEDGAKPAYTNEYFEGVIMVAQYLTGDNYLRFSVGEKQALSGLHER